MTEPHPEASPTGRCFGDGDPLYEAYHDAEWGVAVHDEAVLFERVVLEGFQAGLSWITVLRKRPAFREVFADFDADRIAAFGEQDVERLLGDARIIRNRAKVEATIANARALLALHDRGETLDELLWSYAPGAELGDPPKPRPATFADLDAKTPASTALSRRLRKLGFTFVGPTTVYATMQACGLVDDHLASCPAAAEHDRAGE